MNSENIIAMPVDSYILYGIKNFPEVGVGFDIASFITDEAYIEGGLQENDIIVVASKIVSKVEGRYQTTENIIPSMEAIELSKKTGKPEKICQIIINESQSYWTNGSALLARTKHGFELSSAGVDRISDSEVILLPQDPDYSAKQISERLFDKTGLNIAVIISDSHGRADRAGAGAVALGCYGISPLRVSTIILPDGVKKYPDETLCDLLAAAAAVIMGQRGRGIPVVYLRGISFDFDKFANVKSILHSGSKKN
jgi:coenzyme F420-0:L-glutamate ligase / coenzyme F420-1:gamma-L-glutamate ligase